MKIPLIFISSVQKELSAERRVVRDFIRADAFLKRYFDVFLLEDLPAQDQMANGDYLSQVDRSVLYLGIFGNEYGKRDANGISITEREFDRASERRIPRLVFVKGWNDAKRDPKMLALIRKAQRQLITQRFTTIPDLTTKIYTSLFNYLKHTGPLSDKPFDVSVCLEAKLGDISQDKVLGFLRSAREGHRFALPLTSSPQSTLEHLNLLDNGKPSNAAILLFGGNPQRFFPASEIKCLHFRGTDALQPIPRFQVCKGTVFDQVDCAVDFAMSRLSRSVTSQDAGRIFTVQYDIPSSVVVQVVINAVAHRDYRSGSPVQVMVFSDRVEVWNPGELPPSLTIEGLRRPHSSIPRHPLISEALFLASYVEKVGVGTLDVIANCREANLAEPNFEQRGDQFIVTLWRPWPTDALVREFGLNDRQRKALLRLKIAARITNTEYQKTANAAKTSASQDLNDLVVKGLLQKRGAGRGTYYVLFKKNGDESDTKEASGSRRGVRKEDGSTDPAQSGLRVFLCHSKGDKPVVRELYWRLRRDGFEPWLDKTDLLAGQKWRDEIPRAIRRADIVIVCLSRGSISKTGYVQKEIKYALDAADEQPEGRIFLIPLRLEECHIPARLSEWQWVDYFEEQGYEELLRSLRKRAERTDEEMSIS